MLHCYRMQSIQLASILISVCVIDGMPAQSMDKKK